jgi:hypothetical protein
MAPLADVARPVRATIETVFTKLRELRNRW